MSRKPTELELETSVTTLTAARDQMQGRLTELNAELQEEQNDIALGYEDSRSRCGPIEIDIGNVTDRLTALSRNLAMAVAALAEARRDRQADEDAVRLLSIPKLAARHMALSETAWHAVVELADAVAGIRANADALGAAIGTDEARRLLKTDALGERLRACVLPQFDIGNYNFLTAIIARGVNPYPGRTLVSVEQEILDGIVRVYPDLTEAKRARDRIDPAAGRETLHPVRDPVGLWRLIVGRRRSRYADAPESNEAA